MTGLLFEFADQQAELRPDATAMRLGDQILTYATLSELSDRLARLLQDGGCQPGDRVGIVIPKSPMAIVAMHATMKAGCAYVPVDTASPPARVARVLTASEPRWLLASGGAASLIDGALMEYPHPQPRVGWLEPRAVSGRRFRPEFALGDVEIHAARPRSVRLDERDAAHILFTSGSTGVPKGVVISHANVSAFIGWATAYFGMGPDDRVSGHSPLHFDLSTFDIYGALAAGAELHLVPTELNLMAPRLIEFIRSSELTQWFSVPSVLTYLASFDVLRDGDLPALQRLIWCGEVFPTASLIYWMERLPDVAFTNLYGPTEATIASSYHTLAQVPRDATATVPIGRPCAGEELLILDDGLQEVVDGEIGDLYIGGVGLSAGYWRDPEKTASAFIERDGDRIYRTGDLARREQDGLVYFHGRADTQIKSRGHRIELGEIEAALATITDLRESAVVAVPTSGFEGYTICCAYVPADGAEINARVLRSSLRELVPTYMIPSRWRPYERLPKNANGKIDKPAIRIDFAQAA